MKTTLVSMLELLKNGVSKFNLAAFHYFDWFFVLVLVMGAIYGAKKGMLRTGVLIIEFWVVIFNLLGNYQWLASEMMRMFSKMPEKIALGVSFFILFSVIWAAVIVIDQTISKWIEAKTIEPIRSTVGAFFGSFYFFLILSLLCKGLSLLPIKSLGWLFEAGHTHWGAWTVAAMPELYELAIRKFGALLASR